MKHITIIMILMTLLTACGSTASSVNPQASTTEVVQSSHTALPSRATNTAMPPQAITTPTATSTDTPALPRATCTALPSPTRTTIPLELTGSQASIEKTFRQEGFQFAPPSTNGDRVSHYGWLDLRVENGDAYDTSIWISTVTIEDSLFRAQIGFCFPQRLSTNQIAFVLDNMHLFINASENDWREGSTWVDATLPNLEAFEMQVARTYSGDVLVKLNFSPCNGTWGEGFSYVLTITADPEDQ